MISYAEQELLESIVKNTSGSLQDIYTVLGKVYDDELALDLNIQAAGYSGSKKRRQMPVLSGKIVPSRCLVWMGAGEAVGNAAGEDGIKCKYRIYGEYAGKRRTASQK